MKRIACLIAALAVALTGCDTINQMIGVVGSEYRPVLRTGAIKGKVIDRNGNALVGAKVTNGAAVYFTADGTNTPPVRDDNYDSTKKSTDPTNVKHMLTLEAGEFVLTKVAGNGIHYITVEFDGQNSPALQKYITAATFDVENKDGGMGLNLVGDIKIAVDTPITGDSKAVKFISTNIPQNIITAASASTTLSFYPSEKVSLYLQAPPGSGGDTVQSSKVTYYSPSGTALSANDIGIAPAPVTLTASVTILPGSSTRSGQLAQVDVTASNPTSKFRDYLIANNEVTAKIELFSDKTGALPLKDRDDNPISAEIKLRYRP